MSYRSSTTSLLFVSAVICLAEALQELNEKTIGTEKDSKIAAKSTEGLQQANCFATVLSQKKTVPDRLLVSVRSCSSHNVPLSC